MKRISTILFASTLGAAVLLTGCNYHVGGVAGARGSYSTGPDWGNFKCTAIEGTSGRASIGWATSMSDAKDNALDKCRAHAAGGSCKVTQCVNETN